jgi:hypothetical protein
MYDTQSVFVYHMVYMHRANLFVYLERGESVRIYEQLRIGRNFTRWLYGFCVQSSCVFVFIREKAKIVVV